MLWPSVGSVKGFITSQTCLFLFAFSAWAGGKCEGHYLRVGHDHLTVCAALTGQTIRFSMCLSLGYLWQAWLLPSSSTRTPFSTNKPPHSFLLPALPDSLLLSVRHSDGVDWIKVERAPFIDIWRLFTIRLKFFFWENAELDMWLLTFITRHQTNGCIQIPSDLLHL